MLTMGVDIGSTASKAVILEDGSRIVAKRVVPVGTGTRGPREVYESTLAAAGVKGSEISRVVATGYGRMNFEMADRELSEVSCHGRGVRFLLPDVRTVIDIGGQDAKALLLDERGNLDNFIMNDKCAAGTGRFLEAMARVLDVEVEEMGELSGRSSHPVSISSTCAVFAESEVISRLANGEKIEDIVAGIHLGGKKGQRSGYPHGLPAQSGYERGRGAKPRYRPGHGTGAGVRDHGSRGLPAGRRHRSGAVCLQRHGKTCKRRVTACPRQSINKKGE